MEQTQEIDQAAGIGMIMFFAFLILVVAVVSLASTTLRRAFIEERDRAMRLARVGARAGGVVQEWARGLGGIAGESDLKLTIALNTDGMRWDVVLYVRVERELVASFRPGKTVHVLYDPHDPSQVAIDRDLSPVSIPSTWAPLAAPDRPDPREPRVGPVGYATPVGRRLGPTPQPPGPLAFR